MQFPTSVEQWRQAVTDIAREFGLPDWWIDKVLWTINGESRGDPNAVGDSGNAVGLLQIHSSDSIAGRPSKDQLLDPLFNIRYAATSLGMVNNNFAAWGENNSYNGQPFGALGNNPFPGPQSPLTPGVSSAAAPAPKPPVWISNADWEGGGAWQDPQSGKYWNEGIKDWIVAPFSRTAPPPSVGITQPAPQPAPKPAPQPVTQTAPRPAQQTAPTPTFSFPSVPAPRPVPSPIMPTANSPVSPISVPGGSVGIPQSALTPGQWNEVNIGGGGVQVNALEGWTAWAKLPNGNWQQYGPGEFLPAGATVGLLPTGLSLDKGRTAR